MKVVLTLLAASGVLWPATIVYDCRYYDCVTTFQRPAAPLPPGSSIPQPSWWPPPEFPGGNPLVFEPLKATSTGFVFGTTPNYPGYFLSDGTNTGWFDLFGYPDFHFVDLSDTGFLLYWDDLTVPRGAAWNLSVRSPLGGGPILSEPLIGPGGLSGGLYRIGFSGPGPLKISGDGGSILLGGVNRLDPSGSVLLEAGLTVMVGGSPSPIPEPATVGLLSAGLLAVIGFRKRK